MNATAAVNKSQHVLTFGAYEINIIKRDAKLWMSGQAVGRALEYANPDAAIAKLYGAHADEFTPTMTKVIKVMTAGGKQAVRFFSLRGAHLLAMFARTAKAKEFRVWVLNILDREIGDLEAKAKAGDRIDIDTKMELDAVCTHVEFLRSWWARYGDGFRLINRNAAGAIHDHFSDAAAISRSLARQFNLKASYKEASGYPWDAGPIERWQYSMKMARGAA